MRVFLASVCNNLYEKHIEELLELKRKNYILCSFIEGEEKCVKSLKIAGDTEHFLLDSGAFSFCHGKDVTKKEMEKYVDRFISFINKYDIKYFFEMDVDSVFGLEYVEEIRKKIENQTQKQCIPVWHMNRGKEYWKKMCDEYSYVAIGGLVAGNQKISRKQQEEILINLSRYARSKGVKVHGLGYTKTKKLEEINFYSVDSTSWAKNAIWGANKCLFRNGKIELEKINTNNKIEQRQLEYHNLIEWLKYQDYMDLKKW